jgi:type II secretory pathway component GspD/PulD (secretin)
MKMNFRSRFVLRLFMAWAIPSIAFGAELTVIELRHRAAAELLPILEPLVSRDAALSGIDHKLLVRGSATDVARIREALEVLDRAPKQMMISVRYGDSPTGENAGVGVGGNADNSRIEIRGRATTTTQTSNQTSSVRVIEGNGAHISTGQSVPVVTAVMARSKSGQTNVGAGLRYRELTTGFDVVPRLNGTRVLLNIATQRTSSLGNPSNNGASIQQVDTTIEGQLGEWIELGGVTTSNTQQNSAVTASGAGTRYSTQSDRQNVMVKIDLVD